MGKPDWKTKMDKSIDEFIGFLKSLSSADGPTNRGVLSDLKKGRMDNSPPWMVPKMVPHVLRHTIDLSPKDRRAFYIVASLFPESPRSSGKGNIGESYGSLSNVNQSMEKSFLSMVDHDSLDGLYYDLGRIVRITISKGGKINWRRLLEDLTKWEYDGRTMKMSWVEALYSAKFRARQNDEKGAE